MKVLRQLICPNCGLNIQRKALSGGLDQYATADFCPPAWVHDFEGTRVECYHCQSKFTIVAEESKIKAVAFKGVLAKSEGGVPVQGVKPKAKQAAKKKTEAPADEGTKETKTDPTPTGGDDGQMPDVLGVGGSDRLSQDGLPGL